MPHDDLTITIRVTPWEELAAYTRLKRAAEILRDTAQNATDRLEAELWMDNADRHLERCRRQMEAQP